MSYLDVPLSNLFGEHELEIENLFLSIGIFEASDNFYKNAVNLTYLRLVESDIRTNEKIQEIFKNLTQLKQLEIIQCKDSQITDFGFTGVSETENTGYKLSNLKNLEKLYIRINMSILSDLTLSQVSELKKLKNLNFYCSEVIFGKFFFLI